MKKNLDESIPIFVDSCVFKAFRLCTHQPLTECVLVASTLRKVDLKQITYTSIPLSGINTYILLPFTSLATSRNLLVIGILTTLQF